jgi:hypothetical protein
MMKIQLLNHRDHKLQLLKHRDHKLQQLKQPEEEEVLKQPEEEELLKQPQEEQPLSLQDLLQLVLLQNLGHQLQQGQDLVQKGVEEQLHLPCLFTPISPAVETTSQQ